MKGTFTDADLAVELQKIERRCKGRLTPDAVKHAARDPDHPLHSHFTWDDGEAAEKWRTEEARRLIRSVRYVVRIDSRTIITPYYTHDPHDAGSGTEEQGYNSLPRLLNDRELAAATLVAEFFRAEALMGRARNMAEVLDLEERVDQITSELRAVREEAETRAKAGV